MNIKTISMAITALLAVVCTTGAHGETAESKAVKADAKPTTYHGVFHFVSSRQVTDQGKQVTVVTASKIEGGLAFEIMVNPKDIEGGAVEMPNNRRGNRNPNPLLEIVCTTAVPVTMVSMKPYDFRWGEDETGVFAFISKGETKIGTTTYTSVKVTKYLQPCTLLVPNIKDADGKMSPDSTLDKAIDALKDDQLVEVVASGPLGQYMLKSITPFAPYRRVEFTRTIKEKVGKVELVGIEIGIPSEDGPATTAKYYLNPAGADYADLLKQIATFKAASEILIQTSSENSVDWLIGARTPTMMGAAASGQTGPGFRNTQRGGTVRARG